MPTHTTVDPAELDRHIATMYRDVANEAAGELHFPTGRALAEALGYPPHLLNRLPSEAVRSFAGVSRSQNSRARVVTTSPACSRRSPSAACSR